jgi:very-short-patch-repair endonuclease
MAVCEICKKEFKPRNEKRPSRTCSKECKNEVARQNTIRQFDDPAAREIQRQKSLSQKKNPEYQEKIKRAMEARTKRYQQNGHPKKGKKHPPGTGDKISHANKGRFKGKTWEEIYGPDVAARRKLENSISMSKKNEVLLKERRSSLEEKVLPYLKDYENNIQIIYYNVDFLNKKTKHIIEIHGDYWHCNPKIYSDDFIHPYFKMTAKERRVIDQQRKEYLESLGYSVTVVWESDLDEFIESLK